MLDLTKIEESARKILATIGSFIPAAGVASEVILATELMADVAELNSEVKEIRDQTAENKDVVSEDVAQKYVDAESAMLASFAAHPGN